MKTALLRKRRGGSAVARFAANSLRPDLVLTPELQAVNGVPADFSDVFTHARAGNATVLDADGNLKWAPHNRIANSTDINQFDNAVEISTASTTATAPYGTSTATTIVPSTNSASHYRWDLATGSLVGVQETAKVFLKAEGYSEVKFYTPNDNAAEAVFDLDAGTITSNAEGSATIEDVGGGWYLCGITGVPSVTNPYIGIQILDGGASTFAGDGVSGISVWGYHLYRSDLGGMQAVPVDERGLASSSTYLPTTSAARYLPRRNAYTYVDGVLTGPYIQLESAAATNLVTESEDFTDASWVSLNAAAPVANAVGPDGVPDSAYTLADNNSTGSGQVRLNRNTTVLVSTTYTFSVFAKADQLNFVALQVFNFTTPSNGLSYFNLANGTIGTVASGFTANIEAFSNGWYRCSVTFTTDSTDTSGICAIQLAEEDGIALVDRDGTSSILIYGAQIEAGSIPTSYIPTSGSTATRAAETLTIDTPPWPATVEATGTELVTNGTFDTGDLTGFTDVNSYWSVTGGAAFHPSTSDFNMLLVDVSSIAGELILFSVDLVSYVGAGGVRVQFRKADQSPSDALFSGAGQSMTEIKTHTKLQRVPPDAAFIAFARDTLGSTLEFSLDNISVKEITPRGLAIAMDGLMTYADTGTNAQATLIRWYGSANERLQYFLDTVGTETGRLRFDQAAGGVVDAVESAEDYLSPGINVPFSIASRHGDNFINGAVAGTALTEDATPTILPDLSSTTLQICPTFNGFINSLRVWDVDIGDTGIEEASS